MKFRDQRAGQLIRDELSKIIARDVEINGALMTITEVDVDKKLETAKVRISVLPPSKAKEVFDLLNKNHFTLQNTLFKKLNMRPTPMIRFEIDRGPENAAIVEKTLLGEDNK
ncbi:MAG TPA: ribosome-binding factor A [Candidatus Paceibacterota bacterium]|nr:ribosome-binding factor A [Candidatus Paceibacterota bacterium]